MAVFLALLQEDPLLSKELITSNSFPIQTKSNCCTPNPSYKLQASSGSTPSIRSSTARATARKHSRTSSKT